MENLKFYNDDHKRFYTENTENKGLDCYNKAVVYLLGLTEDTRKHSEEIYNFENREIEPTALNKAWQTSTSLTITRLAFNLFNGFTGTEENENYTVENIFSRRELAEYFYQAIKIRFELI